jgi:hypothetical protein
MEEIEARNITSSCPKTQGYANLQAKMLSKAGKHVSKQQVKNFWGACRRRFQTWTWLESMATGLGTNPYTGSIDASPEWWEQWKGLVLPFSSFLLYRNHVFRLSSRTNSAANVNLV